MWAGLGPRIIMIGTLTALQWFIYDGVKVCITVYIFTIVRLILFPVQVQLRLPRPPPPAMPESLKQKLGLAQQ